MAEKSLELSIAAAWEELNEIEILAEKMGLKVGCMLTMRYGNRINAVREFVKGGKLGEIHNIYFGGQHPLFYGIRPSWYFEEGKHGGVINDIGIMALILPDLSVDCAPPEFSPQDTGMPMPGKKNNFWIADSLCLKWIMVPSTYFPLCSLNIFSSHYTYSQEIDLLSVLKHAFLYTHSMG